MNITSYLSLGALCADKFWPWNGTLPQDLPSPSQCFLHTTLVFFPCIFLLLTTPILLINVYLLSDFQRRPLPWRFLICAKVFLTVVLVVDWCFVFGYTLVTWFIEFKTHQVIDFIYPALHVVATLLLLWLTLMCRRNGVVTSGVVFLSWLVFAVCAIPEFRHWIAVGSSHDGGPIDLAKYISYLVYFSLVWVLVLLHCFADPRASARDYTDLDYQPQNPSPEKNASFLNNLIQWWFTSLPAKGAKQPLKPDELWSLNEDNNSKFLMSKWDKYWGKRIEAYLKQQKRREKPVVMDGKSNSERSPLIESDFENSEAKASSYGTVSSAGTKDGNDPAFEPKHGPPPPNREPKKKRSHDSQPSVICTLLRMFRSTFLAAVVLKLASDLLQFVGPVLLDALITYTGMPSWPLWLGLSIGVGMFVASEVRSLTLNHYFHRMYRTASQFEVVLTNAVYRKALNLSAEARNNRSVGEIVNLMALDVEKFSQILIHINLLWSAPLQIGLAVFLLWLKLGPAAFAGVGVLLLVIPINFVLTTFMRHFQIAQMRVKDKRVKMMNEVLHGIKVVKLYGWEESMENMIEELRQREVRLIQKSAVLRSIVDIIFMCSPVLVAIAAFGTFVAIDPVRNALTPNVAFVSLSLFNILRFPMQMLSDLAAQLVQVVVSNKRLREFLSESELDPSEVDRNFRMKDVAVSIRNGTFTWDRSIPTAPPTLRSVYADFPRGKLIAVVGQISAGKSSLLSAILGEMARIEGYVGVNGSIAFVPQQPWIQNLSLRENITFGSKFLKEWFTKVINACALVPDIAKMSEQELTEIGERGANLSGGQRARLALARAVYQRSDIYLLDDPLSAVDPKVGTEIFEQVIGPHGLLSGRTRIYVTANLDHLEDADAILIMSDGCVADYGTFEELNAKKGGTLEQLREKLKEDEEHIRELQIAAAQLPMEDESTEPEVRDGDMSETELTDSLNEQPKPQLSEAITYADGMRLRREAQRREAQEAPAYTPLVHAEAIEVGKVKLSVYMSYFAAVGLALTLVTVAGLVGRAVFQIGRSLWLADWSNDVTKKVPTTEEHVWMRFGVYAGLGLLEAVVACVGLVSLAVGAVGAGRRLHSPLVRGLLRSPIAFFHETPFGRILNRVGKDVDWVDFRIPAAFKGWMFCVLQVAATLIIVVIVTPAFALAIVPLAALYYLILVFYTNTSRQLKRLEAISRSPIYSHFGETVHGASSVRAYGALNRFTEQAEERVDDHVRVVYLNSMANRWLAVRLDFIGNCVVLLAALCAVIFHDTFGVLTAGFVGLSVSYAMNLTMSLNFAVRTSSELETSVVAVERIKEYSNMEAEKLREGEIEPPKPWPSEGRIQLIHYSSRYRPGLELALRNISVDIAAGEKVGIVGRTGCGKTSLALSLFRLIEAADGKIKIDGIDISMLGLSDLRRSLTIIPQEPVLFSGTLRMNLDPFDDHSDAELWDALEHAHLKDFASMSGKLQQMLTEGGENISAGQRQLVCLARALLRKSKILILDEATVAIDAEADSIIKETIRREFADATILTIAHRASTIMDSDRILVLDEGEIKEVGRPGELLLNANSYFSSLVDPIDRREEEPEEDSTTAPEDPPE